MFDFTLIDYNIKCSKLMTPIYSNHSPRINTNKGTLENQLII